MKQLFLFFNLVKQSDEEIANLLSFVNNTGNAAQNITLINNNLEGTPIIGASVGWVLAPTRFTQLGFCPAFFIFSRHSQYFNPINPTPIFQQPESSQLKYRDIFYKNTISNRLTKINHTITIGRKFSGSLKGDIQ